MVSLTMAPEPGPSDLQDYLDHLFGGRDGFVYAPVLKDGVMEQHFFEWPNERSKLTDHITSQAPLTNVHIAPALFKTPTGAKKDNIAGTQVVWCEFDGTLPSAERLGSLPAPTLRVRSSEDGHEHWYWRLETFLTDRVAIERINRGLTYLLGADASGWDVNQILRPPHTLNHKHNKPVSLVYKSDAVLSDVLFEHLQAPPQTTSEIQLEAIPDPFDVIAEHPFPKQVTVFFRRTGKEVPVGQRSSALMALAYYLAEMGLSDVEMFSLLRNADDRWGKFVDRADRQQRLIDLINLARVKYPLEVHGQLDEDLLVYGYESFLATEIEVEWAIEGFLQRTGSMLLTGPSGVGKTQLSLRFAINMALGKPFLDYPITSPQKSIFFSLEMGHADLKHFLQNMSKHLSPEELNLLEDNLKIVPLGEPLYLDKPKDQARVEKLLDRFEPVGFFVDSIGSMSDEELNEKTAKALMSWNDRVCNSHNVFSWYIHHNRKAQINNKKPNTLADVYGNQYVVNRVTSVFGLWGESDGAIEVSALKVRLAPQREPFTILRTDDLDFFIKTKVGLLAPTHATKAETKPKLTGLLEGI